MLQYCGNSYSFAAAAGIPGGATDPFFSNVVFLHHGAVLSPESSSAARVVTANGSNPPSISATGGYADGSSIFYPTVAPGNLTVPSSSSFAFGTGDFTVEALVRLSSLREFSTILEVGNHLSSTGIAFLVGTDGRGKGYSGAFIGGSGSMGITLGQLTYVAWVRQSGVLSVYRGTTRLSSTPFANNLTNSSTITFGGVSTSNSQYGINGIIDEIRVTNGIARYSGPTITMPTFPFPDA